MRRIFEPSFLTKSRFLSRSFLVSHCQIAVLPGYHIPKFASYCIAGMPHYHITALLHCQVTALPGLQIASSICRIAVLPHCRTATPPGYRSTALSANCLQGFFPRKTSFIFVIIIKYIATVESRKFCKISAQRTSIAKYLLYMPCEKVARSDYYTKEPPQSAHAVCHAKPRLFLPRPILIKALYSM